MGVKPLLTLLGRINLKTLAIFLAAAVLYAVLSVIYNLCFHPLRSFPGPILHRATVLGRCYDLVQGTIPFKVHQLHEKYGPVVRIAPNELAYANPAAWRDIYTRNKSANRWELPRDWIFYNKPKDPNGGSILESHREVHDALRKGIQPAFSDKALKGQEQDIQRYIDLLIAKLQRLCTNDKTGKQAPVNMTDWIAYSTFDVTGFLTFGSDFGCLQDETYHPWVELIMGAVKDLTMMSALRTFSQPMFKAVMWAAQKTGMGAQAHKLHTELTGAKTRARIDLGTSRNDLLDNWISGGMPFDQLRDNASLLIIAGSETTATALTGLFFFILSKREIYKKLRDEVRGTFSSEQEISSSTVPQLEYMHAVISESLRLYPPVPISATREVPEAGAKIDGVDLPPNTIVGIWQYAIYRYSSLFANPHKFDPERWLQKEGNKGGIYANDRLDAVKPFITGPRNCLGMGLAYIEMKLLLARLLLDFDMELCEDSKDWLNGQKIWFLWAKPPLNVKMTKIR